MTRRLWLVVSVLLALGFGHARAADPDWPCQQPLVPLLSAAAIWSGPPLEGVGDWRETASVKTLVERIAPRPVKQADGVAAIDAFPWPASAEERARLSTLIFAGLLEETNRQRTSLISEIKDLGQRQRNLAALVSRLTAEMDAIPPEAEGDDAARRADLLERRTYTARSFEAGQRTVRYACEAPVTLDSRLGAYARALKEKSENR
ncbi:MAG TPA: hypothetical protein VKT70_07095 [Stellaceae bacterium]|nr:hypothetical protein [Stellaceae bacterium]